MAIPTPPVVPKPAAIATKSAYLGPKILTAEEMLAGLQQLPSMVETKELEVEHVILYGGPKTGKTLLAGLLAEFFNILFIDGDRGLRVLHNVLPPVLLKRIVPLRITDNPSLPNLVGTGIKLMSGRMLRICFEHGIIDCPVCAKNNAQIAQVALNQLPKNWIVIFDSVTAWRASAINQISIKSFGAEPDGSAKVDDSKFTFDEWAMLQNRVEKLGGYIKDGDYNLVSISHESLAENEDKSKKLVPVAGSDNSNRNFAKFFGTEILATIVNNKHVFATSTTYAHNVQAGSRANIALEKKKVPSLLHIFRPDQAEELLKGSFNEWYFTEGYKQPEDRKSPPPEPKGVLEI
jgi:hypothetical protein